MVLHYSSPVWLTHLLKHKYKHFKISVFDPGHQEQQPDNYFLLQQGRPNLVKCTGEEKNDDCTLQCPAEYNYCKTDTA